MEEAAAYLMEQFELDYAYNVRKGSVRANQHRHHEMVELMDDHSESCPCRVSSYLPGDCHMYRGSADAEVIEWLADKWQARSLGAYENHHYPAWLLGDSQEPRTLKQVRVLYAENYS